MQDDDHSFLPYTLRFAAITTAAIICLTNQQNIVPSQTYNLKSDVEIFKSWDPQLTYTSFEKIDHETLSQFKTIQNFAEKLYDEITDLDPKIVKMVDDNFWGLLA